MKIYIKRIIKVMLLITTIVFLFYLYLPGYASIGQNDINKMIFTLGEGDNLDVAIIGSSHVFNGINSVQLFEEYGIAAYDFAAGSISPAQIYYYLLQVSETKSIKLAVIDLYTFSTNKTSDSGTVRALINYPIGLKKWRALSESVCDSPLDIMFSFPYSHSEYVRNFYYFSFAKKIAYFDECLGYSLRTEIEPLDVDSLFDATTENGIARIDEDAEFNLRRIIEFCRDSNIQLLLTNTPWPIVESESQQKFNYMQTIADEYGVDFVNGCLYTTEIGLDYRVDNRGDGGHLNHAGVTKYTSWIGQYIIDNYNIVDRRNNNDYHIYFQVLDKYHGIHDSEVADFYNTIQKIEEEI